MVSLYSNDFIRVIYSLRSRSFLSIYSFNFKPSYLDDNVYPLPPSHSLSRSLDNLRFINSRHKNMSLTYEVENNENCHFYTFWLLEKTRLLLVYISIFIGFFLPESYKTGLCLTLLFRTYAICSEWSKIHIEIIKLRNILIKNNFPSKFIDRV